jgi:hypothetical protein
MDSPAVNPLAASPLCVACWGEFKVVSHGRYVAFQNAEVVVPRQMFSELVAYRPDTGPARSDMTGRCQMKQTRKAEVCLDESKSTSSGTSRRAIRTIDCERRWLLSEFHSSAPR